MGVFVQAKNDKKQSEALRTPRSTGLACTPVRLRHNPGDSCPPPIFVLFLPSSAWSWSVLQPTTNTSNKIDISHHVEWQVEASLKKTISEDNDLVSKQLANVLLIRTGQWVSYWLLEFPGASCIVWSNSFRRAMTEVFEKGKTRFPDKLWPAPPALWMPPKQDLSFPMAVLQGPAHSCVFCQIAISCQDLEGRRVLTEPKASSVGTTVYLKLKRISDLHLLMPHISQPPSQQPSKFGCSQILFVHHTL